MNQGAADRLLSGKAASLLPVGITAVEGDFVKDDIVRIVGPDGKAIAMGKANCDADTLKSRMGQKNAKEFVHYDYLYIEQL